MYTLEIMSEKGAKMIEWFGQGGFVMWIILVVSLISWIVIFERAFVLFMNHQNQKHLENQLFDHLSDFKEEIDHVEEKSSLAVMIKTIWKNRHLQQTENVHGAKIQLKEEMRHLEKGLVILEISAGAAPLLGLLGTVLGMVEVFGVISKMGLGDPTILSGGISKALNTTVFGLIVAIPSMIAYSLYERKIEGILIHIEKISSKVMNEIYKKSDAKDE